MSHHASSDRHCYHFIHNNININPTSNLLLLHDPPEESGTVTLVHQADSSEKRNSLLTSHTYNPIVVSNTTFEILRLEGSIGGNEEYRLLV